MHRPSYRQSAPQRAVSDASRPPPPPRSVVAQLSSPDFALPRSPSASSTSEVSVSEDSETDQRRDRWRLGVGGPRWATTTSLKVPIEEEEVVRSRSFSSPSGAHDAAAVEPMRRISQQHDDRRQPSPAVLVGYSPAQQDQYYRQRNGCPSDESSSVDVLEAYSPRYYLRPTGIGGGGAHQRRLHSFDADSSHAPDGHRRRLPPTPEELAGHQPYVAVRRCSTPRKLPTPPPQSPRNVSPELRPPSATYFDQGRRGSGRRLPLPPDQTASSPQPPSSPVPTSPTVQSPQSTTSQEASARRQQFRPQPQREDTLDESKPLAAASSSPPPSTDTPPPRIRSPRSSAGSYSQLLGSSTGVRDRSQDSGIVWSNPPRKYSDQQQRGSFDQSYGSPSTNPESQTSSLSPSIEQLTSKSSSDTEDPLALGIDPKLYRQSSVSSNSVPDFASAGGSVSNSSSWPDGSGEPRPTGLGLLHYSLQHFPVRRRLRVSILKVEGLAGQLRPELELHAFCKVCLLPGKGQQKQHSRIVKRTRDAVFNEEFFFDNIGPEELVSKSLSIRVCHHIGKQFQKDVVIGDIEVPLKDITELASKKEVRLVEELKPKINVKKLGKLHISSCLEKEARRLTINLIKAEDLPKWGISGPPDPCIRITLTQQGKSQTKQSRVLKHTCSAVYREAVMFLVSTKAADLDDTSIMISVHDTARTASGDDLVGSAFLGKLARDRSELDQWRNTIEHPGKEFKATHQLKLPKYEQTPHVHVSETQSDSD